ncbi:MULTISPECIES: Lrp/AsnC family transcriptional regulator [Priestia]|uniref:AsnC family transcriptional regulator n=2 Tax=Priestia filamentosa TaxID=1402861 RepID=A0A0H4KKM4_9BACI|nr:MULTISPECIES: Lrp/AsnC family transcriptional regulator [Priestia]AKO93391.1 AsnC family transcriptional regulator [Priestia filamentosa]MCM3538757.1 Lrp/AsnC family transcriptional regulator [Priestia endophytica]MCY8231939.1 Lrp/AsnC family transcriptional regulator [Priestia endophytica]MED3726146.1 Lrp/AsnC family transcriptional regulator [Priestia filamentosa]RJS63308.1 Lrp/AsnC family transcriptional regulator [Priestia filamentosa]
MKIDELDIKIMKELKKNARLSIRQLSQKVNLSPPSVAERVRRLEDEEVIERYTIDVNRTKLGYSIDCIIEVTVKNGKHEAFKTFIEQHPNALFCYRITGKSCFMVMLTVEKLEQIEDFINDVTSYTTTFTNIIFSSVKLQNESLFT